MALIDVQSPAFETGQPIPVQYTADGAGLSPPLKWKGIPNTASRLIIVVEDADSPTPQPLVHAIVLDNDARRSSLAEGALKSPDHPGSGMQTGRNSYLSQAWLPPDPPPGHGPHRYVFQVFALGGGQFSQTTPGRKEVLRAIEEHGVAAGYCIGTYERGA
jgi:Raf kinase inhibitor-like YbhB/YbcL family protein